MKICIMIAGFGNGGAQKQCIKLLNLLSSNSELDIHLIYFYEGVNFYQLKTSNINLNHIPVTSFFDIRNVKKINDVISIISPDLLMSWLHTSDVYAFMISILNKKLKWIMTERDSDYPNSFRFKLRDFSAHYAHKIIANSDKGLCYWRNKKINEDKLKLISNIVEMPEIINTFDSVRNNGVCFCGRFEKQKNIKRIISVFEIAAGINKKINFNLIGEGSEIEAANKLSERMDNVVVLGFQKEINNFFVNSRIFVSLSLHEGMPNTVLENIALRNIVFISDIPEHRAIVGASYPYLVSLDASDEDISNALLSLHSGIDSIDVDFIYSYAFSVLDRMTGNYISQCYVDIFEEVLNNG